MSSEKTLKQNWLQWMAILFAAIMVFAVAMAVSTDKSYAEDENAISVQCVTLDENGNQVGTTLGGTAEIRTEEDQPSGITSGEYEPGTQIYIYWERKAGYGLKEIVCDFGGETETITEWFTGGYLYPGEDFGSKVRSCSEPEAYTFYFQPLIERVDAKVTMPKCETEIKQVGEPSGEPAVLQTPVPEVAAITKGFEVETYYGYEEDPAIPGWFKTPDDSDYYRYDPSNFFLGKLLATSTCYIKFQIIPSDDDTWSRLDFTDEGFKTKLYVNGKEADVYNVYNNICAYVKVEVQHDWDEGKVTTEPTATKEGVKTYTCKSCKLTRTEPIPVKEVKKATAKPFLLAQMTSKNCNAVNLSWMKVKGAAGYEIYFSNCDKGDKTYKLKKVKTIKGASNNKWTKKKLSKNTAYKAYVKAYAMKDGKKSYIATSPAVHAITGGSDKNYTNAKSVSVKKSKVSLKVGATSKITASVKKVNGDKKLLDKGHTSTLRYYSNDKSIAKVSKSGKITAVAKGSCKVYAIAANGVKATVKVTVK